MYSIGIIKRCEGEVDAKETAIGYVPYADDINLEGCDVTKDTLEKILDVDPALWRTDVEGIEEFYAKFGKTLPAELRAELDGLKGRLQ